MVVQLELQCIVVFSIYMTYIFPLIWTNIRTYTASYSARCFHVSILTLLCINVKNLSV